VGELLELSEADVLAKVHTLFASGVARRFGAVFDARSLGYESTLCAADVPEDQVPRAVAPLVVHPGVTHCYEREGQPNLWFTLTAPRARFDAELERLAAALRPREMLNLPMRRTFKIEAVFDPRRRAGRPVPTAGRGRGARPPHPPPLDERTRAVVRRLQEPFPLVPAPFAALGAQLGWPPAELLALLVRWRQTGLLRRIGLIVRHRELGFAANGLCAWRVPPARIAAAGRVLAACPAITHCYERRPHAQFPYNLFAMLHAADRETAGRLRDAVAAEANLDDGLLRFSTREWKKTSPRFFETEAAA